MNSRKQLIWAGVMIAAWAANAIGQDRELWQPSKPDWSAIGKSIADELPPPKKAEPVSEKIEFDRAKRAIDKFRKKRYASCSKSEIDGVWRASQGVYYVFERGRSAQILFLDMMSADADKSAPITMESTFRLTKSTINFHPDTTDSRHVSFELIPQKNEENLLRMNLNGDQESTWRKVRFD